MSILDPTEAGESLAKRAVLSLIIHIGRRLVRVSRRPIDWSAVKKVLVIRRCCIGDVIMSTPLVRAIRKALPHVRIDYFVGRWAAEALAGNPDLDEIVAYPDAVWMSKMRCITAKVKWILALRRANYDVAFVLDREAWIILIPYFAGIGVRIGFDVEGRGFSLTHGLPCREGRLVSGEKHILEFFHELTRHAGLTNESAGLPRVYWTEDESRWAEAVLAEAGVPHERTAVGLAPGGGRNPGSQQTAKRWPADRFGMLADRVVSELDCPVVFLGGPGDREVVRMAQRACNRPHPSIVGSHGLTQMAALVHRLAVVVANDSGMMHLSVGAGTRTVGIFGPTLPAYCGPYGRGHSVVYKALPCTMCARMTCPTHECMKRITVDDVFVAVRSALDSGVEPHRPAREGIPCGSMRGR